MDDTKIITLQCNWQRAEKAEDLLPSRLVGKKLWDHLVVFLELFAEKLTVVVLAMTEQDVQIVIAKNTLRTA